MIRYVLDILPVNPAHPPRRRAQWRWRCFVAAEAPSAATSQFMPPKLVKQDSCSVPRRKRSNVQSLQGLQLCSLYMLLVAVGCRKDPTASVT